jgi:hypothetical protein
MDSFPELKYHYLDPTLSDITLIIDGKRLPSHKFVLSAKSEVFKAMLFGDLMESNATEVEIKDTTSEAFETLLKYCYFESFALDDNNDYEMAFDVFKIAHRFQFKRLMILIEEELIKLISIENLVFFYEFSKFYELNDLMKSLKSFCRENALNIIESEVFLSQSFGIVATIVSFMNVSQTVVISLLQKIQERNSDSDLKPFIDLIVFDLCSIDDLVALQKLNLFSDQQMFEAVVEKYRQLEITCNEMFDKEFP